MPFPEYVPTRTVLLPGAASLEDAEQPLEVSLRITADRSLIWAATGYRMERTGVVATSTPGGQLLLTVPRTDVSGWRDADTGALIDVDADGAFTHRYTAVVRVGGQWPVSLGPFVVPEGDGPVVLTDLLPVGTTSGGQVSIPDWWSGQITDMWDYLAGDGIDGGTATSEVSLVLDGGGA